MTINLKNQLDELALQASQCIACPLHSTRNKVVFGSGKPNADIMFVGEAPGQKEDETGLPFVGRAGELLDKILDRCLGLTRNDVYIANVVKCRPPNNRNPEEDEIRKCRPFLHKQIMIVQPKVIVALGKIAIHDLTKHTGVMKDFRGKQLRISIHTGEYYGDDKPKKGIRFPKLQYFPLVATWHPAYLLRQPQARWDTVKDMKLVEKVLANL